MGMDFPRIRGLNLWVNNCGLRIYTLYRIYIRIYTMYIADDKQTDFHLLRINNRYQISVSTEISVVQ